MLELSINAIIGYCFSQFLNRILYLCHFGISQLIEL